MGNLLKILISFTFSLNHRILLNSKWSFWDVAHNAIGLSINFPESYFTLFYGYMGIKPGISFEYASSTYRRVRPLNLVLKESVVSISPMLTSYLILKRVDLGVTGRVSLDVLPEFRYEEASFGPFIRYRFSKPVMKMLGGIYTGLLFTGNSYSNLKFDATFLWGIDLAMILRGSKKESERVEKHEIAESKKEKVDYRIIPSYLKGNEKRLFLDRLRAIYGKDTVVFYISGRKDISLPYETDKGRLYKVLLDYYSFSDDSLTVPALDTIIQIDTSYRWIKTDIGKLRITTEDIFSRDSVKIDFVLYKPVKRKDKIEIKGKNITVTFKRHTRVIEKNSRINLRLRKIYIKKGGIR